jgi:minor extracellular serine protease Vpr
MRRKLLLCVSLIALLASVQAPLLHHSLRGLAAGFETAANSLTPQASQPSEPVSAIFELDGEPVASREALESAEPVRGRGVDFGSARALSYESELRTEHADFKSRATLIAPGLKVRAELRKLANAVSIEATPQEIAALSALPGVKQVQLTRKYHATLDSSVPLINAPAAWERLGGSSNAGEGIKIAILDTGIDITNPLFDDSGFTAPPGFPKTNNGSDGLVNNKVIVAKSYLRGTPTPNAADGNGHGSNVAGIAAGDFNTPSPLGHISGVAPRAFLGNYRVLDAGGSGFDDKIAQALEDAVADGFDVINLSLGADADSTLNFLDQTVETAVNAGGKIVVISAGNSGSGGSGDAGTIGSPGVAPSAITVAAATNAHVVGPVVSVLGPSPVDASLTGITATLGAGSTGTLDASFSSVSLREVTASRACAPLQAGSLSGSVALIERGNCTFASKVTAAAQAGAIAAVIYNQDSSENPDSGGDNLINMDVTGTTIPSVFIGRTAGLALRDFVRANPTSAVNISELGEGPMTADIVADFSSRGPSTPGALKPDITAPGVIIYSAAIKTANANGVSDPSGFLAISGTSQAAPHISGSAALIKQLNPSFTPQQVKSALMNSAVDAFLDNAKTNPAGVLTEGGGRVDLDRASSISALFAPSSLSFGTVKNKKKVTVSSDLTITAQHDGTTDYTLSVQELDPDPANVSLSLSQSSISLGKGESATITLTIKAAKKSQKRDYTGYIIVAGSDGQTLRVPYWIRLKKKV